MAIELDKSNLVYHYSVLNGMVYFRGHSKDFDEWEELGNPGWGWKDVLPFYKRAEKWAGPNSDDTYGTDGHLNIRPSPYIYKVVLLQIIFISRGHRFESETQIKG